MNKIIVIISGIFVLGLINFSIWQKQQHIAKGEVIRLELAPVDPRSIMQGDYMTLNYAIQNHIRRALKQNQIDGNQLVPQRSYVVVAINENSVAQYVRLDSTTELAENERKLEFRVRNNRIKFATNAFFFAEGDEPAYTNARFGQFSVNEAGEVLLVSLLDKDFQILGERAL